MVEGIKISEMPEKNSIDGTELIPIVDGSSNKKVKTSLLMNEERISAIEDVVFPYSIQVSGGGTFEKGVSSSITVTWTVKKGNDVITPDSVTVNGEVVTGNSKVFSNVSSTVKYTG